MVYNLPLPYYFVTLLRTNSYLQSKGINIIPNIRWGDARTYGFAFEGIVPRGVVAVGTHGCIREQIDRNYFKAGLAAMYKTLRPDCIVVYGQAPDDMFGTYVKLGIKVVRLEPDSYAARKRVL